MSWGLQHPWVLAAWPLIPLALWWSWRGRARLRVASLAALRPQRSLRSLLRWLPAALRALGLSLLLLALARPQTTREEVVVESEGLDILLAIDTSQTMEAQDLGSGRTRMSLARETAMDFVRGRPYDRIGVVVFGEEAFTQVPLTQDHDALLQILAHVDIGLAGSNATAIGHAIAVAAGDLADLDAPEKVLVLITDGKNTVPQPPQPMDAAQAAATLGIRVYTIGVGAPPRRAGGIAGMMGMHTRDGIDEPMLRAIAKGTGGRFYRAASAEDLQAIFETIDQLETTTAQVSTFVHRDEKLHLALLPGLALLLAELLLSHTLLRRLP